jgi:hypothetical protein
VDTGLALAHFLGLARRLYFFWPRRVVEIPALGMKLWQLLALTGITAGITGWILGIADAGRLATLAAALIITLICWRWIEILRG